ncbi:MAG: biotin/lipoyl-containing protein [Christensenella sp.]
MRKFVISVNGNSYNVDVEEVGTAAPVAVPTPAPAAVTAAAPVAAPAPAPAAAPAPVGGTQITSPMPGTILDIKVTQGQQVAEGDVLVILEAMKMENEIMAPNAGTVVSISAIKGSNVDTGDLLVVIG